MSTIVVPDCGKTRLGNRVMKATHPPIDGNSTLKLYSNNPTLGAATVAGDFTEISMSGYSAIALTGASDGGIDGADRDTWTWPTSTVTASGAPGSPVTAVGYYVVADDDGTLLWCQKFDSSFTWTLSGDAFPIIPKFSFGQL